MSASDNGGQQVDTGQGVLVGVQPSSYSQQVGQQPQGVPPGQGYQQTGQNVVSNARWTDADIERARQEEKEKLYPRIEEMGGQLKELQEQRQAEAAERQRLAEEATAAQRAKEEQEMDLRALMEKRDAEWQSRFQETEARYAADRAVFEQERRLQEVTSYRQARIEQESEYLLPQLRKYITGDTPEEIDAAIEAAKAETDEIFSNFTAASQQQQPFRGAAMPSVPPVGPMEQLPSYETLTPQDIAGMDMDTYKRYREQLLRATSPQQRRGQ